MAINEELRQSGSNVVVSALCPGPVNTNFNKVAMGEFSNLCFGFFGQKKEMLNKIRKACS